MPEVKVKAVAVPSHPTARSEAKSVAKGCGSQPTQQKFVYKTIAFLGGGSGWCWKPLTKKFHHQKIGVRREFLIFACIVDQAAVTAYCEWHRSTLLIDAIKTLSKSCHLDSWWRRYGDVKFC